VFDCSLMAIHPIQFELNKQIWEALQYYKGLVSISLVSRSLVSISLRLDTSNFVGTSNIHVRKKINRLQNYQDIDYWKYHLNSIIQKFINVCWLQFL
jgi:hypothetical protein